MNIALVNDTYYIGVNLVDCLAGSLKGKIFEVIAVKPNGKEFKCMVEAENVDHAQSLVEHAARKDKVKFVSFRITLKSN